MVSAARLPPPFHLLAFDSLGSTNEEACRRAAKGAPHGTVVQAGSQTSGRGRRGRQWISPPGNLHCSLVLKPDCALAEAANVGFVAALALGEALVPGLPDGVDLRFKWPNDVLLDGGKIAGFLLESANVGARLDWLVLGLGVNVEHFPEDTEFPATSLRAAGFGPITVDQVLAGFCRHFGDWYGRWRGQGFAPVRTAWLERAAGLGEVIEVGLSAERIEGRFLDIDSRGALVVGIGDGTTREITAGDVFFPSNAGNGAAA